MVEPTKPWPVNPRGSEQRVYQTDEEKLFEGLSRAFSNWDISTERVMELLKKEYPEEFI